MVIVKPKESLFQRTVKFTKGLFLHNTKQKAFALVVAGIMWVFILGREENRVEKDVFLEYQLRTGVEMPESVRIVKAIISGPSGSLRKLNETSINLKVDITQYPVGGLFTVELPKDGFNLPLGVKVESLKPSRVPVVLRKKSQKD